MAAVNDRLKVEVTEVQSELAEVKAEATRSAAKAKAQRQNAHIADRERLQEDLKEMVSDRCSSHRYAIAALSCPVLSCPVLSCPVKIEAMNCSPA